MNINILEKQDNRIFGREELKAEIEFEKSTPARIDIRRELAKKLGTKKEFMVITQIKTLFGKKTAVVRARIYKDEESLKKTEPKVMVTRQKPKAERKKEPGKNEEKKEE